MPPIVSAFPYRNADAMGGMIWCYAGAKRDPISDGRHLTPLCSGRSGAEHDARVAEGRAEPQLR